MFVFPERLREAIEKRLHRRRIGIGQHEREGVVASRFDGGEDVGEGKPLVAEPRRALPPLPPDMADAAFLPDARFILEKQPDALAFMRTLKFFEKLRGSF